MVKNNTNLTEQIEKKEQEVKTLQNSIKELKAKQKEEMEKVEWLAIPELGIEIQTKIHHKGKTLADARKDLKGGEEVASYEQLQWLRNSKYRNQLNLLDTWEYVYPNPDKISEENSYVAVFNADSIRAYLYCDGDAGNTDSGRGVRFARKISQTSSNN